MTYFESPVRTWANSPNINVDGAVHAPMHDGIFLAPLCRIGTTVPRRIYWDALRNATADPVTCLECLAK